MLQNNETTENPQSTLTLSSRNINSNLNLHNSHPMFYKRDPSTWGLIYSGSFKDPPIEEFLFRVEKIPVGLFKIDINQLVHEFGAFLKEGALNWY